MPKRKSKTRNSTLLELSESNFDLGMAIKIIPEFSGESSKIHKFLSCCDIVLNPHKDDENNNADFLSFIITKLNGQAYNIVKSKKFNSWGELKAALITRFATVKSAEQIQSELVNSKQGGLDVKAFALKIEELLSELNDACIASEGFDSTVYFEGINEKIAIKSFCDGLRDRELKTLVKACQFTELKLAIQKAIEEDQASYKINPNQNIVTCQICDRKGHSSLFCRLRYQQNPNFNNNLPDQRSSQIQFRNPNFVPNRSNFPNLSNNRQVFNNQNYSQNYPAYNRNFSNQPPFSANVRQIQIQCAYCHFPGHHISNCRKKKFADMKKNSTLTNNASDDRSNPTGSSSNHNEMGNEERLAALNLGTSVRANQL